MFGKDDYEAAKGWIFNLKSFGDVKLRLAIMESLMRKMGNPERKLRVIHVGGTNGKGSTVSIVSSILRAAGFHVGAFTKPHLTNFTERIAVDGVQISESRVIDMLNEMMPAIESVAQSISHPTFFEITAAIMLKYFAEQNVDYAVIEVGMGGRLDATNVVTPLVSIITNVSLEHIKVLGDTVEKISIEKAGIIKPGGILVTTSREGDALRVFRDRCEKVGARMITVGTEGLGSESSFKKLASGIDGQTFDLNTGFGRAYSSLRIPLLGEHQITNASAAVTAIEALTLLKPPRWVRVSEDSIRKGLSEVNWPGRMEVLQKGPYVIIDGAKDVAAARTLAREIRQVFDYDRLVLVVSISSDKNIGEMMHDLVSIADEVIATRHKVKGRAIDPRMLAEYAESFGKRATVVDDVKDATRKAVEIAGAGGLVLVTGSIFTIGEAREIWHKTVDYNWKRDFNES
jgi:dihydrofolate synthase / folylpolyglutamate synthase